MIAYVFPGQGSQKKGMGAELFDEFKELTESADRILGYSIKELCLEDPNGLLNNTMYTQPAIFIVSAMMYMKKMKEEGIKCDYLAGHSLGEYNALFAAGVMDFENTLKLVKKRGELMSKATKGAMAAIIGLTEEKISEILSNNKLDKIDIANFNSPKQIVISGLEEDINDALKTIEAEGAMCIKLKVSGAFHSRYMEEASKEFGKVLDTVEFKELEVPVIANLTARPYKQDEIRETLILQMMKSVKWTETVRYLMGKGVDDIVEIGPGNVLTGLVKKIKKESTPLIIKEDEIIEETSVSDNNITVSQESALGSDSFKKDYKVDYAYIQGSIENGIASKEMVISSANSGILGILESSSSSIVNLKEDIQAIKKSIDKNRTFGVALNYINYVNEKEKEIIDVLLNNNVNVLELSNYMTITKAIVFYRLKGLKKDSNGTIKIKNKIICKVNRLEVCELFLQEPPKSIVASLLEEGTITKEEAELSNSISMVDDICIDDYSMNQGGIVSLYFYNIISKLRKEVSNKYLYKNVIRIGINGLGTPESAGIMFNIGMDFIMTSSINQCTKEAKLSSIAKDMLQNANIQDIAYVPKSDFFEFGEKKQILKRGVLFHARANKLYEIYKKYDSIRDIDSKVREQLEKKYFRKTFEEIIEDIKEKSSREEVIKIEQNEKSKMAAIFKWYLNIGMELAQTGDETRTVDYSVQCDSALGALNECLKGTKLESWREREVGKIAQLIMEGANNYLKTLEKFNEVHN